MTIPMVIRVKSGMGMSMAQWKALTARVEAAYEAAKEKGVPLVVGDQCEVLWPVERWEHDVVTYSGHVELYKAIQRCEVDGWQVCSIDGFNLVFKRPAREDDDV